MRSQCQLKCVTTQQGNTVSSGSVTQRSWGLVSGGKCPGQYPKIGKLYKKMEFTFALKDMHCQQVLTFLWSPIEWLTFCQNLLTCYCFLWKKKLNFHFFHFPIFGCCQCPVPQQGQLEMTRAASFRCIPSTIWVWPGLPNSEEPSPLYGAQLELDVPHSGMCSCIVYLTVMIKWRH